jgi:hypothetical protein
MGVGVQPGAGQAVIAWTPAAGAASYNLYRSTTPGGEGATPVRTGITTPFVADTGLIGGITYYYEVTAVDFSGESGRSVEVAAPVRFGVHINFSNNTTQVPPGYINDIGLAYGDRGNGFSFGWNVDNTANARDRDSANSPDECHDSFIHMEAPSNPNASWQIAVPNGTYSVHLLSGDPINFDSVYRINVNGILALSGVPDSSNFWFEHTVTVTVTNGRLTVSNAVGSQNNKIDCIDITQL